MRQRILAGIILSLTAATSNAALLGRLPATPGGTDYLAYYDTVLDITWLADANYAQTSGYVANGLMTWAAAQTWIGTLNTAGYLGTNDWRLPTVTDTSGCVAVAYTSTDCGYNVDLSTGEMAHIFYGTLGNTGRYDTSGNLTGCSVNAPYCLTNAGPFSNLQGDDTFSYWSGTEYAPTTSAAWVFNFGSGFQGPRSKDSSFYAWAVRPGDIGAVPIPAVGWLLAPAFAVLMRRRVSK